MFNDATTIYADCVSNASSIGEVEFSYCSRDVTTVAHEIARSCFHIKILCNWVDEPPKFILNIIVNDATIILYK
jgi:siroheme synthase (precorrin-2 oxidase/ferrochelatase)